MSSQSRPRARLYLITPAAFSPESFAPVLARALASGDVACLQLRMKGAADSEVLSAGALLRPIAQTAGASFLVNDRPDLAAALDADGVHLGQEDGSIHEARKFLGPDKIIGVTCHASRHLAMEAGEAGADYVAFGAFHPSATKAPPAFADPEILSWWQDLMEIPCVAIGGITPANAAPLVRAGADFLAVSAGVWAWPDGPEAAVRAFNGTFDALAGAA